MATDVAAEEASGTDEFSETLSETDEFSETKGAGGVPSAPGSVSAYTFTRLI